MDAVIDWSQFRGELYACLAFLDFLHFQFFILIKKCPTVNIHEYVISIKCFWDQENIWF